MPRRLVPLLLALTFTESFATILLERGIYFFARELLSFTDQANLALALLFGLAYFAGALASHPLTARFRERRMLGVCLIALIVLHALIALMPTRAGLFVLFPAIAFATGFKWPILESYLNAGIERKQMLRRVAMFSVAWGSAVPAALAVAGPLIDTEIRWLLLALPIAIHIPTLLCLRLLPRKVLHMPDDHPDRPDTAQLARYRKLMTSSRWLLLSSYALLFLVGPLLPGVLESLGHEVQVATGLAALLDVSRVAAFAALGMWTAWYGRTMPLLVALVGVPLAVLAILFGGSTGVVLAGEVAFGLLAGTVYIASLYYALAVKNASVDAGGWHEGLIGLGFALGPMSGLVGHGLTDATGSYVAGMLLGVAPLVLLCGVGSLWPLLRSAAATSRHPSA